MDLWKLWNEVFYIKVLECFNDLLYPFEMKYSIVTLIFINTILQLGNVGRARNEGP